MSRCCIHFLCDWSCWQCPYHKHLRSTHNALVSLLAASDFLIIGYLLTMNIKVLITNSPPDNAHCRIHAIANSFLLISSAELIMLSAISRYVKVCHSLKCTAIFTVRNIIIIVISIYVLDAMICSTFWFYEELWTFDRPLQSCVVNRYTSSTFSTISNTVVLGIPIIVTVFCYFKIYRHVYKARKNIQNHLNHGSRRKIAYENMITKANFSVFLIYLILYEPIGLTFYFERSTFPDAFHTISFYMCYLNSCINCFIYGLMNKDMRRGFVESLFIRP